MAKKRAKPTKKKKAKGTRSKEGILIHQPP